MHGYALTGPHKCRCTDEPNFTMSSVGICLINFGKQRPRDVFHLPDFLKIVVLCFQNDIISFAHVLIAIIPSRRPFSTVDQGAFVKKTLLRSPPFCFPGFAETVRLHSGTLLQNIFVFLVNHQLINTSNTEHAEYSRKK